MSHAKNKLDWCLNKAEKELKENQEHRGLVRIKPDKEKTADYVNKAEHFLRATIYLKEGNFSDISASTIFYAMYHSLLAIAMKFGYESHNQECTFALIAHFIEDGKIGFDQNMLNKIATLGVEENTEETTVKIREKYQYGTKMKLEDDIYNQLLELAQQVISKTKEIIEE